MQFPLRTSGPCAGKRVVTPRNSWLPGIGGGLRTSTGRQAHAQVDRAPEGESTTASSAALTNSGVQQSDHSNNVIDVDAQAIVTSPNVSNTKPTAAISGAVEGDWLEPTPGDWGGTVDPQGIKEPDSSGVLFFFIIIAGLSLGVHQVLRYLGAAQGDEPFARPPSGTAAVVVSPASRAKVALPTSKVGASADDSLASTSVSTGATEVDMQAAVTREDGSRAVTSRPQDDKKSSSADAVTATEDTEGGKTGRFQGPAETRSGLEDASETGTGSEVEAESENPIAGRVLASSKQQQAVSGFMAQTPPRASTDDRAARSDAVKSAPQGPVQQNDPASAAVSASESQARMETGGAGVSQGLQRRVETPPKNSGAEAATASAAQPLLASTSSNRDAVGDGKNEGLRVQPTERASLGAGLGSNTEGSPLALPSGASAFFLGTGSGPSFDATPQAELSTSARLSLPAVRPEPLSRAPDSSALTHLPSGSSISSLRERAHLALRAAAAAVEASQRAAAYAAAASNAASRAAEAAERAATAATMAQTGLENAAESAIAAAEARVAQAVEAAEDAEERAASAAAHATAYQDMSQSQADIAERAAAVPKPATPGPLSQLQQLWRSASSAFIPGHQQDSEYGRDNELTGIITTGSTRNAERAVRGSSGAYESVAPAGNVGAAAAETISSTVKGLLSWLGQGDGTR